VNDDKMPFRGIAGTRGPQWTSSISSIIHRLRLFQLQPQPRYQRSELPSHNISTTCRCDTQDKSREARVKYLSRGNKHSWPHRKKIPHVHAAADNSDSVARRHFNNT